MNKYIAALDFGTQQLRVIVECHKEIVYEKNFEFPYAHQSVNLVNNKFELTKRGIKSIISDDIVIAELEKLMPYDFYLDCFRKIFLHISGKIELSRLGIIVVVPELYSEIQRFTLKEIVEKAGFYAVKILNFSKVCAESIEMKDNSVSEVISIGADYTSFSLIRHENGTYQPFDMETKCGTGGYYMDKLLFDKLASDAGIHNLDNKQLQAAVLNKLVTEIESLKLRVLHKSESVDFAFSYYSDSLKDITIDLPYCQKHLEPFYLKLSELQSAILERNKNLIINQTILTGELIKLEQVKRALNIQSKEVIYVDFKDVLKEALQMGRVDMEDLLDKDVKPEMKTEDKQIEIKEAPTNRVRENSNADLAGLMGIRLNELQECIDNNTFDKAEMVLHEIEQIKISLETGLFSRAANHYYLKNECKKAYSYIKKAIALGKNESMIRLFENIVFKEVERLQKLNLLKEVTFLLKDAKDLNVSEVIKEAFIKENRRFSAQNHASIKGSNYTPPKKKRH